MVVAGLVARVGGGRARQASRRVAVARTLRPVVPMPGMVAVMRVLAVAVLEEVRPAAAGSCPARIAAGAKTTGRRPCSIRAHV